MLKKILAWVQQPTTIAGLATFLGTIAAVLQHLVNPATGMSLTSALPVLLGGVVAMGLNDNTGKQAQAVQIATGVLASESTNLRGIAGTVAGALAAVTNKAAVIALMVGALLVSGCASKGSSPATTAASWANAVAAIQLTWPIAEAGINADLETISPAVTKAEATATAAIAALSGTSAPTSLAPLVADLQAVVAAIPTSSISAAHQQQIQALLAVVQAGVGVFG
jgi:hypothetical protein